MPIMRHGEAAIQILNLNLNLSNNSQGHCVGFTTIVGSIVRKLVVVMIRDDGSGNMLIKGVLFDKFFDEV